MLNSNEQKTAIYALYGDEIGKLQKPKSVESTLKYFDEFYKTINDAKRAKREIDEKNCVKNELTLRYEIRFHAGISGELAGARLPVDIETSRRKRSQHRDLFLRHFQTMPCASGTSSVS